MYDTEMKQPCSDSASVEVIAAIEALRPSLQPNPLRIEDCTTPELRLEYIAQWLEAGAPHAGDVAGFNMTRVIQQTSCGTVCCIAGCAITWWGNGRKNPFDAAGILGLGESRISCNGNDPASRLFFGQSDNYFCLSSITPAWAARCIRKYQRTGIVDWEGTQ